VRIRNRTRDKASSRHKARLSRLRHYIVIESVADFPDGSREVHLRACDLKFKMTFGPLTVAPMPGELTQCAG
jgi:hypothetical protein